MARNTVIPITQVRVIDTLNIGPGGQDWRGAALGCIADHIRHEPDQIVDHYEVKFDGMILTVDLDEDHDDAQPVKARADQWDDPLDLDIPN